MDDKTETKPNEIVEYMMNAPISADEMTWIQLQKAQRDAARDMSRSHLSVPPHLRDNPYDCLAVVKAAKQWGLKNEYFVAQNSYVTTDRHGIQRLSYTSAVYQAVLKTSGAIIGAPQYAYEREGNDRVCTASVLDRQTRQWESATTPPLRICKKNSPLWTDDPDQQLSYFAIRRLVRQKYAEVFGGLYDKDEFEDEPAEPSPSLIERLPGRIEGAGFSPDLAELKHDEAEAIAAVQAQAETKKRRGGWQKGRKRGPRARPTSQPQPEPVAEEPQAPQPAPAARQEGEPVSEAQILAEPQNEPTARAEAIATAAEARLPIDEPPYRGPPRTATEWRERMKRMPAGIQHNLLHWYDGQTEVAFRAKCGISGLETGQWRTLMQEEQDRRDAAKGKK